MIRNWTHRRPWFRYAFAVIVVAAAATVRLGFLGALGQRAAFITCYPAVILAALYGGFPAGMLAAILSAATADYLWMEPVGGFSISDPADLLSMAVFLLSCTMISLVCQALHRARARADIAEAHALLAAERARAAEEIQRISEQAEKAQRESREREQFLANLIEKAEQPLAVGYPDGQMGISNRAFCKLTGYSAEELRSVGWKGITPPEWMETEKAALAELERTGEPVLYQKEYIAKDGRRVPVELLVEAARNEAGQLEFYYAFVTDITQRRAAEEALRQQREWLRVTLTSIGDAVLATDTAGKITFLNPTAAALTGWTEEQAMGQPVQDVFHIVNEQTRDRGEDIVGRVLREGQVVLLANHTALVTRDGREIPVEDSAAPIRDSAGNVTGVVLVFHDVAEKRRALEALRESETQFRTLANAIPQLCWMANADGWLFWYNQRWYEYTGATPQQMEGWGWQSVHDPKMLPEVIDRWKVSIASGEPFDMVFPLRGADGVFRPFLTRVMPVHDQNGKVVRWFGTNTDVSEQRKIEAALRDSEARFRNLFESMDEGFASCKMIYDDAGRPIDFTYLDVNPAFAGVTGLPVERVVGRRVREVIPEIEPFWIEAYGRIVRSGNSERIDSYVASLGKHFEVFAWRSAPGRFAVVFSDVTERKRAEESLRQAQKLESVGLLAGGIAHDFNNLLVGVIGNASMAQDLLPRSSPVVEHLQAIVKSGEQAAHLTRQMLAYAGKGRFVLEPVNLSGLVAEASTLIQSSVSKKITFHVRPALDLSAIEADSSQMQQVFMNLALNAAEAIGSDAGVISISTGEVSLDAAAIADERNRWPIEPGTHVFLEVRDTGCGMDKATQQKIFDPFFSTKFQGRGLGLAAVAGIVRAQKGAIQLTTAPGAGSTFRVLLPAMGTPLAAAATPLPAERKEDLRGAGTVLVVDDEKIVRDLAQRCLERQGYQVLAAQSGPAAIEILRSQGNLIRLVILDLSMPGMGGEETLPRLRDLQPDLPVIVSSGHSETEALRPFGNTKLSGFLQKPYTIHDLARRVKAALG
jgi:PAS domain S-box-containing protein